MKSQPSQSAFLRPMKRLIGGPFDGSEVPRTTDSILLSGAPVPEDQVARYRFSAGTDGYRFIGLDRVVMQVPIPSAERRRELGSENPDA